MEKMRLLTAICPSVGSEDRSGHRGLEGQHCAWDRPLATWGSGLRRLAESAITRPSAGNIGICAKRPSAACRSLG